jgi:steroid 5-alpha reductase family enzyme
MVTIYKTFLIVGGSVFVIGLIGQTIADLQLYNFKKKNKIICNVGLWHYSRHPNYFFECTIWLGISVTFLPNIEFLLSFIAPATIFIIVYFITGPLTEKSSLKKHGETFANYQKTTSYFFPRASK